MIPTTSKPQPKEDLGKLHPLEEELIRRIREQYRFGEITVVLHEGLPRKIKMTTVYDSLDSR